METSIGEKQLRFMPGRSTTDAIFALRQVLKKHLERRRGTHVIFIDVEKPYDRIPRQQLWRCMRKSEYRENMLELYKTRIRRHERESEQA